MQECDEGFLGDPAHGNDYESLADNNENGYVDELQEEEQQQQSTEGASATAGSSEITNDENDVDDETTSADNDVENYFQENKETVSSSEYPAYEGNSTSDQNMPDNRGDDTFNRGDDTLHEVSLLGEMESDARSDVPSDASSRPVSNSRNITNKSDFVFNLQAEKLRSQQLVAQDNLSLCTKDLWSIVSSSCSNAPSYAPMSQVLDPSPNPVNNWAKKASTCKASEPKRNSSSSAFGLAESTATSHNKSSSSNKNSKSVTLRSCRSTPSLDALTLPGLIVPLDAREATKEQRHSGPPPKSSTANHSTANHSTANHSTSNHSTSNHSTANHSTANHSTSNHSTSNHSTANHSSVTTEEALLLQLLEFPTPGATGTPPTQQQAPGFSCRPNWNTSATMLPTSRSSSRLGKPGPLLPIASSVLDTLQLDMAAAFLNNVASADGSADKQFTESLQREGQRDLTPHTPDKVSWPFVPIKKN